MHKYITIFKPKLARHLLKKGFAIVDIKADKDNSTKTNFIFERTISLLNELDIFDK